jgi:hypothetical protein
MPRLATGPSSSEMVMELVDVPHHDVPILTCPCPCFARRVRLEGLPDAPGRLLFMMVSSQQGSDYSCVTPNSSCNKDFKLARARSIFLRHT